MNINSHQVEFVENLFSSIIHIIDNECDINSSNLPFNYPLLMKALEKSNECISKIEPADLVKSANDCINIIKKSAFQKKLHPVFVLDLIFIIALSSFPPNTRLSIVKLLESVGLHHSWEKAIRVKFANYYTTINGNSFSMNELITQINKHLPKK